MSQFLVRLPQHVRLSGKTIYWIIAFAVLSNIITIILLKTDFKQASTAAMLPASQKSEGKLYLSEQAATYVMDVPKFERAVKQTAKNLNVPPEWIMAVIFAESKFDASAVNKNNGATGLIQWKSAQLETMGVTTEILRNLSHEEQLKLIEKYYLKIKKDRKPFETLTEFYLGIFYPDALGEDYCYALYKQTEPAYKIYAPIDVNKDGQITVKDIDERLRKYFPTAYMIEQPQKVSIWARLGW